MRRHRSFAHSGTPNATDCDKFVSSAMWRGPPGSSRLGHRAESCLGGIWESADGRAWSCVASDPSFAGFGPYAAAPSPSVVVAVGLDGSGPESDKRWPGGVWRKLLR